MDRGTVDGAVKKVCTNTDLLTVEESIATLSVLLEMFANVTDTFVAMVVIMAAVLVGKDLVEMDVCIISDPSELFCSDNEASVVVKLGDIKEKLATTPIELFKILMDVDGKNDIGFVGIGAGGTLDAVCIRLETDKLLLSGCKTDVLIKLGETFSTVVVIDECLTSDPDLNVDLGRLVVLTDMVILDFI
jgi:hypothetical protein